MLEVVSKLLESILFDVLTCLLIVCSLADSRDNLADRWLHECYRSIRERIDDSGTLRQGPHFFQIPIVCGYHCWHLSSRGARPLRPPLQGYVRLDRTRQPQGRFQQEESRQRLHVISFYYHFCSLWTVPTPSPFTGQWMCCPLSKKNLYITFFFLFSKPFDCPCNMSFFVCFI